MGGCGSLSGRWLHGAEHGAPRPETDVKGHRAKANKSCDNERFIEIGPKLLADRHTDRGLLPRHGVRYIAMNDGIDTMRDNNDIAPFKNILNEMYSKDISKKVHSSYLLKAQQGQFTGCVAPFGYRKDPEDKTTCWWTRKPPHCPANLPLGAGRTRPQLYPAQAGRTEGALPYMVEPGTGLPQCPHQMGKERPGKRAVYVGLLRDKDILMNPVYTGAIASQRRTTASKSAPLARRSRRTGSWWRNGTNR